MVDHNLTNVVSSPAEDSHSGTSHSPAPVEKWRDLFVSNRNTITVASNGCEIVKSKKARKSPSIPIGATHTADQVSTTL
ncbi:hypothetical protein NC652_022271 [Populus alba x Populus x berolinensis]|nr:hypothetical protein NC652_022271 [Populus alba x Populus x berolinensis]